MLAENVIRFPVQRRRADAETAFLVALYKARAARFAYFLRGEERALARLIGDPHERARPRKSADFAEAEAFDRMQATALVLAATPAPSLNALALKRRALGHMWLKLEGEFHDALRAGVAADEERHGNPVISVTG